MTTTIVTPNQDAIVSEIEILAPPQRVFEALTDPQQLTHWFGNTECPRKSWHMDARVGGHYGYTSEKGKSVVNGVSKLECHGEILECDPPRLLIYTWIANWHDDTSRRTVVRWDLTPTRGGTHLKVTHSGLSSMPVARKDYSGGWTGVVEMLKKFVETR